ncbi:unnamed protein product [Polarella glacialis]|uniref:Uncharacterized protein n=1 Tax=Polarella glacialis TaxID=89957 RepID=A0A813J158_POLGL|nr:unnamed protein product [Polarella glacialis]
MTNGSCSGSCSCSSCSSCSNSSRGQSVGRSSRSRLLVVVLTACVALKPWAFAFFAGFAPSSHRAEVSSDQGAKLGGSLSSTLSAGQVLQRFRHALGSPVATAAAAGEGEQDGPLGDWVECEISFTPTIGDDKKRRSDTYTFHKKQLQEDFGHLYAKLGFTIQEGVMYKDIKTACREPDGLKGTCSDCFRFMFGGTIGFVGTASPKYYGKSSVSMEECVGDTMKLQADMDALPVDNSRPDTSIWCMQESTR